jgi:TolB protein
MINADGSRLLQLTSGAGNNEYPSWSPDGSMIVFSSTRDGKRKLYVMNVDGANQKPLLRMAGEQQQPSWSGSK